MPLVFIVVLAGVLLAWTSVRQAAVTLLSERRPVLALSFAPAHPKALEQSALAEIGAAAAVRQTPSETTFKMLETAARREPLADVPLLVAGTAAMSRGDAVRAERLLLAAQRRDPRASAPHFLLADLYLRQNRVHEGLLQLSALSRLMPGAPSQLAGPIAAFARTPGGRVQVRALLESNGELKGPVLDALASDAANARLVVALAGGLPKPSAEPLPSWVERILQSLVQVGRFEEARRIWGEATGIDAGKTLVFNPGFGKLRAPAPFNWSLYSGSAGLSEFAPGGGLHILFFGREDASLVQQTLTLAPGGYRLSTSPTPTKDLKPLGWRLTCLPKGEPIATLPVAAGGRFQVPPDCKAQALQLIATATSAEAAGLDLTIRSIDVKRDQAG